MRFSLDKKKPNRRTLTLVALALAAITVLTLAIILRRVLTPVIIALVLAYIVDPFLCRLERHGIRRWMATTILYVLVLALLAVGGITLGPRIWSQAQRLYQDVSGLAQNYESSSRSSNETNGEEPASSGTEEAGDPPLTVGQNDSSTVSTNSSSSADSAPEDMLSIVRRLINDPLPQWRRRIRDYLRNHADEIASRIADFAVTSVQHAARGLGNAAAFVFQSLLVLVFTFFFMLHFRKMAETVKQYIPAAHRDRILHILSRIDAAVSNFFRGRLLICLIAGVVYVAGLRLAGIDFWLLFGIAGGILSFIPVIGVIIPMIPACAFALLTSHPWTSLLGVLVTFSIVQWVVEPVASTFILSSRVKMHPVTIILALLIGGSLFGMFGMILSVPLAAIVKILAEEFVLTPLRKLAEHEPGQQNDSK